MFLLVIPIVNQDMNPAVREVTKRQFLKAAVAGLIGFGGAPAAALSQVAKISPEKWASNYDDHIKDYLHKMRFFNRHHPDDVFVKDAQLHVLRSSVLRLRRLQRTVGHGRFNLLTFDSAVRTSANYSRVGGFSTAELNFLETLFYEDASHYGFLGVKPLKEITDDIRLQNVIKIPYTGNYLYKGPPLETYNRLKSELGDQVILTSGIRSVVKQFLLFLNKTYKHEGNLSLASRQLAPPGYSFHGIGDFDVGQVGFGAANFTERFISTRVYRRLRDMGYLTLRYPQDNMLGVRYEPWHIKVKAQV